MKKLFRLETVVRMVDFVAADTDRTVEAREEAIARILADTGYTSEELLAAV